MSAEGWMRIKRSTLERMAEAIRQKKGSTDPIDPADFPAMIRGMSGKLPSVIDKTVTELTFEDFGNATEIGYIVFRECPKLKRVEIPAQIQKIDGSVFLSCRALSEVVFEEGSLLASIGNSAFSGCSFTSIDIPMSVTSMDGALYNCSKLESVTLPLACGKGKSIFGDFFSSYSSANSNVQSSLKTVTITNASSVPENCFNGCDYIEKIVFESGCSFTTVGKYAFQSCDALSELVFPASLTSVQVDLGFLTSPGVKKIVFYSPEPPTISSNTFFGITDACEIYVLPDSVAKYKAATNWSRDADKIFPLEEGV